MVTRFTHQENGQHHAKQNEHDTQIERLRRHAEMSGDPTRGKRGARERNVPREFIESHREAAPRRPDQIDLHDHGRRPCQSLADAQEHIRDQYPGPRLRFNCGILAGDYC